MNSAPTPCPLSKALLALLPGAHMRSRKRTGWHSATFSGERVAIELGLTGDDRSERVGRFADTLPDTEFRLRRQLVADILVCGTRETGDGLILTVEALLLDE